MTDPTPKPSAVSDELINLCLRAYYEKHPFRVTSLALHEATDIATGEVIPFDTAVETGWDFTGTETIIRAALEAAHASHAAEVERLREKVRLFPTASDVLANQEMKDAKGNLRSLIDQQSNALADISAEIDQLTATGDRHE